MCLKLKTLMTRLYLMHCWESVPAPPIRAEVLAALYSHARDAFEPASSEVPFLSTTLVTFVGQHFRDQGDASNFCALIRQP